MKILFYALGRHTLGGGPACVGRRRLASPILSAMYDPKKEKNLRMSGWSVVRASCRPAATAMLRWVGDRARVLRLYRSIAVKPSPQVRWPSTHRCGFFFDKKDFSLESPPVRRDRLIDPMGGVSTKLCATNFTPLSPLNLLHNTFVRIEVQKK